MTGTLLIVASVTTHAAPAQEMRTMLSSQDVAAIEAMVPAMAAAWRTHDAAAYARQFVPDAEHINAYGMWWRGRYEIEQGIAFALTRIYADNPIVASDVTVSAVTPKVAILQYRWRLKPYSDPDGTRYADPQGRVTDVLVRTKEGWRIRNFQSTFINPKVPQPR
ncbi:SgcJ/EcaC family oxidoreductase [Sphingomonas endolithica]|uniref:SgcJ/EcaC family oxidoreductase n=1 Tax=Sphingomonas endolithica TaxID=2972485 RepID=UPI0021AE7CF0|nr:SgcJ/EcaC family oxidoreductase [Sphingomonas sp. ZFBP2030]